MFFNFLFSRKRKIFQAGDVVVVKSSYLENFPIISKTSLLTVEGIENDSASVVFMNENGSKILRQTLPLFALKKVA